MTYFEIRNTLLDSNNWVQFDSAGLPSFSWRRRARINPLDGQTDNSSTRYTIAQSDVTGVENPASTVPLFIDVHDFTTDAQFWNQAPSTNTYTSPEGVSMVNRGTLGYLKALQEVVGGETYIRVAVDNPTQSTTTKLYWVKSGLTSAPSSSDREIPVEIQSIDIVPDASSSQSHLISVNITFTEVRYTS